MNKVVINIFLVLTIFVASVVGIINLIHVVRYLIEIRNPSISVLSAIAFAVMIVYIKQTIDFLNKG